MKLHELLQDRDRITNRLSVPVLLSSEHAQACADTLRQVGEARKNLDRAEIAERELMARPLTDAARAELEAAEAAHTAALAAAEQHLVNFQVESVGSDEWERLVMAHPPTKKQREQYGDRAATFDPQTFPEAAVAACLVEPEVDGVDDIRTLRKAIPDIVWQQLFAAVLRVNRGANEIPKWSTGSATTPSSANGSGPPSN